MIETKDKSNDRLTSKLKLLETLLTVQVVISSVLIVFQVCQLLNYYHLLN